VAVALAVWVFSFRSYQKGVEVEALRGIGGQETQALYDFALMGLFRRFTCFFSHAKHMWDS